MAKSYTVERAQHVAAPPSAVRERVVDFHRWQSWSPWEGLDPDLSRTYGGADAGIGAWYAWDGNRKAGRGRMEIVEADDEHVAIDLRFDRPFKSHNHTQLHFTPEDGGTQVRWTMTGPLGPAMRLFSLFSSMDKMIGPDFERGLAALKTEAEADGG